MKRILIASLVSLLLFSSLPFPVKAENKTTLNEQVIYDILVDRFNNGRQAPSEQVDVDDQSTYNGGDIEGVTKMLGQLEEHGFTAVSLSPIMENAERGYHGYWVEDFYEVEEEFGSMDDIKTLVSKAHDKGMKVILELPLNYIAKSSPLVEEKESEGWFKENEVEPIDATEWLEDVYVFDQENEAVQDYLFDVANYWMEETKADGFKLHAADQSSKTFLTELTAELKKKDPNFYFIATTLQGGADIDALKENENIDAIANEQFYKNMNEVFMKPDEPVSKVVEETELIGDYRDLLYVDNINTPRFSNNFGDFGRNRVTAWKLALAYLYLTPGVPIVYQGSEVPMFGPGYPENQYFVEFTSADPEVGKVFDQMSAMRKQFPQFTNGDMEQVAVNEGLSLLKRTYEDKSVYVAINNDSESHVVTIDDVNPEFQLRGLLHDDTIRANEDGEFLIGMERESVEVFIIQAKTGFNWNFIGFVIGVFVIFIGGIIILTMKQRKREKPQQ